MNGKGGRRLVVAFQGELGAFSEEAVLACFGPEVRPLPCREVRDATAAVRRGAADRGVLPVENSIAGTVTATYAVLAHAGLEVTAEVILQIRHFLLGAPGATLATVKRVLSHPVALAQCTRFLEGHPGIQAIAHYDTAGAARDVAQGADPATAAIASRTAAERYGLDVLAADVQDRADNQTRFLAVARAGEAAPGQPGSGAGRKTLLVAETQNVPGALLGLLVPLADEGINMTKLETTPADSPWTYRFFIEFEGDVAEPRVLRALEEGRRRTTYLAVLGSFDAAPAPPHEAP